MARVFTRKEVEQMIAEAVAKSTAPLLERIAIIPCNHIPQPRSYHVVMEKGPVASRQDGW